MVPPALEERVEEVAHRGHGAARRGDAEGYVVPLAEPVGPRGLLLARVAVEDVVVAVVLEEERGKRLGEWRDDGKEKMSCLESLFSLCLSLSLNLKKEKKLSLSL